MHNFDQNPQNPHFKLGTQAGRGQTELQTNLSQHFLGLNAQPLLFHGLDWEIKHCKKILLILSTRIHYSTLGKRCN